MRNHLIAFLFAACLPIPFAGAGPFAEYNPSNGDVVFRNVRGQLKLGLFSRAGLLNPNMADSPFELTPPVGVPPIVGGNNGGAGWAMQPINPFAFDMLTVRGAVQPLTPLSDLSFTYHPPTVQMKVAAPIVQIPEPTALALAACGLFALSLIRRRG